MVGRAGIVSLNLYKNMRNMLHNMFNIDVIVTLRGRSLKIYLGVQASAHQRTALPGLHKSRSDHGTTGHQQEEEEALFLSPPTVVHNEGWPFKILCFKNALAQVPPCKSQSTGAFMVFFTSLTGDSGDQPGLENFILESQHFLLYLHTYLIEEKEVSTKFTALIVSYRFYESKVKGRGRSKELNDKQSCPGRYYQA